MDHLQWSYVKTKRNSFQKIIKYYVQYVDDMCFEWKPENVKDLLVNLKLINKYINWKSHAENQERALTGKANKC